MLFAIVLILVPSSISTYAAAGGDANSFAHAIYFLLLAILASVTEVTALLPRNSAARVLLQLWPLVVAWALLGSGVPLRYDSDWRKKVIQPPAAVEAFNYCKRNPGQVYFPANSMAVYFAERKFYETDWGVMIVSIVGRPPSRAEVLQHLPRAARYIALPRDFETAGAVMPFVAPHRQLTSPPQLDRFYVYALER
jgi:hypothetical protein